MHNANKNIIIATHIYATGPAIDLKEYLKINKVKKLLFIGHPLFYDKKLSDSGFEYYKKGVKITSKYADIKKRNLLFSYMRSFLLNIIWSIRLGRKWDVYVGSNNLNALSGIVLKWLGVVNKTIYYVIDLSPKRFDNKLLNSLYHKLDHFCVNYSDETWDLSPRIAEGRRKYFNFTTNKQRVVPLGIWYKRISSLRYSKRKKNVLVFMGHITKKQGVQRVIDAIPEIIKKVPDFRFLVIGGGEYLPKLQHRAGALNILEYVNFTGFVKDHREVEKMLTRSSAAVAMYDKYENGELSFTYFADPGKIKVYLACGLPVLLSDVPYNAKDIERNKCGVIVTNKKESIAREVIGLLNNQKKLIQYRKNAINYAKKFDWEIIFRAALKNL